jgi:hypothetical protein
MGAETQNQQLAGGTAARARMAEDLKARRRGERPGMTEAEGRNRRMRALEDGAPGEAGPGSIAEAFRARREEEIAPQVGQASMFPGERPGMADAPKPPGYEEAVYRRGEVTRERDRTGRRAEIFRNFQRAAGEGAEVAPGGAVERGVGLFGRPLGDAGQGTRSGVVFGPGRANRMPDAGSPEYAALVERMRGMGRR